MYSRRVIERNIERLAEAGGPELAYHTPEECEQAADFFRDLAAYDDKGELLGPKRAFTKGEQAWILNERLLAKFDFHYFLTRYCRIRHYKASLVPFNPNVAQAIILDRMAELEEQSLALLFQVLKARQLGLSTLSEAVICHRATFHPHTVAIVGSSDPDKSALMFKMVERMWEASPWWLLPRRTKYRTGVFYEYGELPSRISIQHGTQLSGIGRGDTPNVAHLSEIVDYDDPEELINASLIRAMHESPEMFLVLESTAKGRGNWWHRTWLLNCEEEAAGIAKLHPIFLPWFVGSDLYPTETWLRARPVPENWQPKEITAEHAARAAQYVATTPMLARHLGSDWEMSREQQWFYEVERNRALKMGELGHFLGEVPASPEEAFTSTNNSIFPIELLQERRERTRLPQWAFVVDGDEVPARLSAVGLDRLEGARAVPVRHWVGQEKQPLDFLLRPVRVDSKMDPHGKLLIWEWPERGAQYGIGVDTGWGLGQDRSVIQVVRKGDPDRPDEQVAEWASSHANAYDLWPIALAVAALYSPGRKQTRVVIEVGAANGDSVQMEMRKHGWRHFHVRKSYNKVLGSEPTNLALGWSTNVQTRKLVLDHLIKAVKDDWLMVRSPWLLEELASFEQNEKTMKIEAAEGSHDDRIMAVGIVYFSIYDLENRREGSVAYRERLRREREDGELAAFRPSAQAVDLPAR